MHDNAIIFFTVTVVQRHQQNCGYRFFDEYGKITSAY